jgi:hypothetical protein
MSGFDNGTLQGGVSAQVQQLGPILRGAGDPAPQAGVLGGLYIDVQTWNLFAKRTTQGLSPWGHYLFNVPVTYRAQLKWFSSIAPTNDIGVEGDYCLLWGGFANYGMQPSIFGPKVSNTWPNSPVSVSVAINPLYAAEDQHGV